MESSLEDTCSHTHTVAHMLSGMNAMLWWMLCRMLLHPKLNPYYPTLVVQTVKNLLHCGWFDCFDWEDPVEKGMATHSSILAWRIPRTEEPDELHSPWGCKELDTTRWLTLWLSHPSFGESCWQTAVTGDTASGFVSTEERKSYLLSRTPPRNDRSKWGQKALALSTHLELWKVIPPSGSTAVVRWDSP